MKGRRRRRKRGIREISGNSLTFFGSWCGRTFIVKEVQCAERQPRFYWRLESKIAVSVSNLRQRGCKFY